MRPGGLGLLAVHPEAGGTRRRARIPSLCTVVNLGDVTVSHTSGTTPGAFLGVETDLPTFQGLARTPADDVRGRLYGIAARRSGSRGVPLGLSALCRKANGVIFRGSVDL